MLITPPSTNNFDVGLQNKNSAAERISGLKSSQQRITQNNIAENQSSDSNATFGLQDRQNASERLSESRGVKQRLIDNHGMETKFALREALTNNTKIINIPVMKRGSLLDVSV